MTLLKNMNKPSTNSSTPTEHMNTIELFDDYVEMTNISKFAEEHELTVDYVICEFVINNKLQEIV